MLVEVSLVCIEVCVCKLVSFGMWYMLFDIGLDICGIGVVWCWIMSEL